MTCIEICKEISIQPDPNPLWPGLAHELWVTFTTLIKIIYGRDPVAGLNIDNGVVVDHVDDVVVDHVDDATVDNELHNSKNELAKT